MTTSNRLDITELVESQNNRSATVNEAIAKLEAGAFCFPAVSIGDTSPPGSPAEGDLYCLGAAPTGAWSGQATKVAVYYNAAWEFLPALEGALAYAQDANAQYYFDGSAWSPLAGGGGLGDVIGPASAVNNDIALFDTTTGKLIKDSGVAISTDGTLASNSDAKIATEKATKTYVDGIAVNLGKRARVRAATTATITISTALNNGDTLDGVTLATGDLVLVKNQSAPEGNGVYVVGVSPARSSEFDTYDEHPGSLIVVEEGTANADTLWICSSNAGGTLDTTAIAFSQIVISGAVSTSRQIISGGGLTGGGDLSADRTLAVGAGAGITVNADDVALTDMAQSTIKGRAAAAGTGAPTDLTATQATAILNAVVGDSGSGGTKGLVPAPGVGDAAAGKYLKADGTFAVPPGTGVTSLASTTEVLTGTDTAKAVTADALAALWEKGADTASAGTVSLGEGGFFHITGTTTITDIDWATAKDGRPALVIFDGILTLTHNATTLKLPGGANITTAAGDRALFVQDASDNVICILYVRADGTPLLSSILRSDTAANLTKGFTATAYDAGTKSSGTFTPDPANGNLQRAVNGGAHTLAPPSVGSGDAAQITIQYTNNGSAGTLTTSGFTKVTGSTLTTVNGDDFMLFCSVINGFSLLNVVALQ